MGSEHARRFQPKRSHGGRPSYLRAVERLVEAIQELSLARDLEAVAAVVRRAARELTGADGATFVLRDRDQCFYAEENAIAPLWKGRRFPMTACISGWAMLNRQVANIEDIYADPRVPADAYRPTFVRSLAMVPIRTVDPIGAIGNYWACRHRATPEEVRLLQALADSTSVALENAQIYSELEQRVRDRTAALAAANEELEAFSYSVSHDLRSPLARIGGTSELLLLQGNSRLDKKTRRRIEGIAQEVGRMARLIDDLLRLACSGRAEIRWEKVDLSALGAEILEKLKLETPTRTVVVAITPGLEAIGDNGLLRVVLENLLGNAWKYTATTSPALISLDGHTHDSERVFAVRDNGVGFEPDKASLIFQPFRRLHEDSEFTGSGIGLATVRRILTRHGGRVWAESAPGQGTTVFFALPGEPRRGSVEEELPLAS